MTAVDYDALKRDAGDCPLGPWIVQRALTQALSEPSVGEPVLPAAPRALAALEAWAHGLDRYSAVKGPLLRLLPQLAALVRDA